jgi:uncharacterized membrane protein
MLVIIVIITSISLLRAFITPLHELEGIQEAGNVLVLCELDPLNTALFLRLGLKKGYPLIIKKLQHVICQTHYYF